MRCFNCSNLVPSNSQFCHYCGADLTKVDRCVKCGNPLDQGMYFCPICGTACNIPARSTTESSVLESALPKRKRKWPIALICFLAVAITIGGLFIYKSTRVDLAEIAENVLYLEVYDDTNTIIGSASGFLVNDGTTLVTNYHVIEDAYRIVAMTSDGYQKTEILSVVSYDDLADLAVLKCVSNPGVKPLTLADSDVVKQGDIVYAAGYPLGLANTLSDGIISSRYIDSGMDTLQITAPISGGSSGGALLNGRGEVVGIICAYYEEAQNLNIAIAANELAYMLQYPGNEKTLKQFYTDSHSQTIQLPNNTTDMSPKFDSVRILEISFADKHSTDLFIAQWESGPSTETFMAQLMDKYRRKSERGFGAITIKPGDYVPEVDAWCFDPSRRPGDVAVIECAYGYSVCYFSGITGPEKLKIGISADFPPYEYYDSTGALVGIEVDLMHAIAEEINFPLEFVDMHFDELFSALASGKINCIASGLTETSVRNLVASASIPWDVSTSSLGEVTSFVIYVDDEYEDLLKLINNAIEKLYNNGTIDTLTSLYNCSCF
ncbi:MAG: trypsin-like peptidase domain-containing protein [Clostridia bacterium]|nr:trypsin-like peptidase domain-containing protein [Clostridia bacterium]